LRVLTAIFGEARELVQHSLARPARRRVGRLTPHQKKERTIRALASIELTALARELALQAQIPACVRSMLDALSR